MKSFVVSRKPADFEQMLKIWKWCEEAFGKPDYFTTWNGDFARNTEDYVEFTFYRDEMASAFVFRWNEHCISRDEQVELGMLSWQDYSNAKQVSPS